jgi:hypothetical protein
LHHYEKIDLEDLDARACHAIPLGSVAFTEVQEVPHCKAFGSCAFTRNRMSSQYLLTETLTETLAQNKHFTGRKQPPVTIL